MKRLFSALLVLILLLSCFAGCKKDTGTETTGTVPTTGTTPDHGNTPDPTPDGLALEENGIIYESLAQKAVVKTALAYLARGTRIQYDDTRLNVNSVSPVTYRWQSGARKSPEEYTSQYTGYSNCAAFTAEVYLAALGCNLPNATNNLAAIKDARRVYQYKPTGNETDTEKATVEQEFFANLKMGDIIVIRYNGNKTGNGHAMLYVGSQVLEGVEGYKGVAAEGTDENGTPNDAGYVYDIIHSTGSSYSYEKQTEKYESHGTVQIMSANSLFDSKTGRYVFTKLANIGIIRPLNTFDGEVPENSKNRMLYMDNIIAEKLSSHTAGMTVNPGDTMTFTFRITNKRTTDATLEVKDILSDNLTYVSSENCTAEGNTLNWTVTVPAGKTVDVTYTAKVKDTVTAGQVIESTGGTVGGISVIAPKVFVGHTLSADEQAALLAAIEKYADSDLRGTALANALYGELPGLENLLTDDAKTVLHDIFRTYGNIHSLNWEPGYIDMVAPGLFGGRYVTQRSPSPKVKDFLPRFEDIRTRMVDAVYLMAGDILIASVDANDSDLKLYMYTGGGLLDLNSGKQISTEEMDAHLIPFLSYDRFAVLRPSLMKDSK